MKRFAALVLLVVAPAAGAAQDVRTDAFVVEAASLGSLEPGDLPADRLKRGTGACVQALLGDHAIRRGSRTVIALRRYFHDSSVLDADAFVKLSIEVSDLRFDEPIPLDGKGVRSLLTAGGEAWYPSCFGGRATPVKGEVTLHRDGDAMKATLRVDTSLASLQPLGPRSTNYRLSEGLELRRLRVDELDAWQGGGAPAPLRRDN